MRSTAVVPMCIWKSPLEFVQICHASCIECRHTPALYAPAEVSAIQVTDILQLRKVSPASPLVFFLPVALRPFLSLTRRVDVATPHCHTSD